MRGLAEIKYVNEEECKAIKARELEAKKKEVERKKQIGFLFSIFGFEVCYK